MITSSAALASVVIPAGHGTAVQLTAGQAVKVINTHGTQVVDCWAWKAYDLSEYMCMEATRVWNQRLNPVLGDTFVTSRRNPILTLIEDKSPGVHDTFMAACDLRRYELLGVKQYHRNCCDNMVEALDELELVPPHLNLASFNIFMNIQVQPDGITLHTLPTVTKAGDYISLRAEMDCVVAFSACPQDIVKIQGAGDDTPKPVCLEIFESTSNLVVKGPWVPNI